MPTVRTESRVEIAVSDLHLTVHPSSPGVQLHADLVMLRYGITPDDVDAFVYGRKLLASGRPAKTRAALMFCAGEEYVPGWINELIEEHRPAHAVAPPLGQSPAAAEPATGRTVTVSRPGWVFRWARGSFIAGWHSDRADQHVPDVMVAVPSSLKLSRATPRDIEVACDEFLAGQAAG